VSWYGGERGRERMHDLLKEQGRLAEAKEGNREMNVRSAIIDVMDRLGFEASDLKDETSLHSDLGIDSTELTEITVALERHFGIRIISGAEESFGSFGDLLSCVQNLLAAKPGTE
jgi:acyl carrier protein